MPHYKVIKLKADDGPLQAALQQLNHLAENNPDAMKEFYSLFTGPNDVCSVAVSVIVGNELHVTLTASDRFLEFLANRQ